jgi:putative ABC transport system substrate-binding protein
MPAIDVFPLMKEAQAAAQTLGLQLHVLHASTERDLDEAFRTSVQLRAGSLVISPNVSFNSLSKQFGALTLRYGMPTIYQFREFAAAGGLLSYGGDVSEFNRQVGVVCTENLNPNVAVMKPTEDRL